MLVRRLEQYVEASVPTVVIGFLVIFLFAGTALGKNQERCAVNTPMVIFIHSRTCKVCAKVRPLIDELETAYEDKLSFVRLDVTDEAAKKQSKQIAKGLGVTSFLAIYEDTYPCVGVFNSKKHCVKEMYGLKSKEDYVKGIEKGLASE